MKKQKEELKTIGMGLIWNIIVWIIGIIFILIGLMLIYRGLQAGIFTKVFLSAILFILAGFIIAIKVSLMILLLFPLTIISAAMFIHNPYLNKGRIYLDISLALAILTLIILRS